MKLKKSSFFSKIIKQRGLGTAFFVGVGLAALASVPYPKIHSLSTDPQTASQKGIKKTVKALLQERAEEFHIVGISLALIDHGTIEFFSYGKMEKDGENLVSESTIFEIGSITKLFTTLALASMVKEGLLQLDDPIELYLPDVKIPEKNGVKITLRHLATHTSALPGMPDNFTLKNPYEDYTIESLYSYLNQSILMRTPGESFEYSNLGMGLLGHILSLRSSKSYEELIQDRILMPLEMKDTVIELSPSMEKRFASGHNLEGSIAHWDLRGAFAGATAFRSNAKDLSLFLISSMDQVNSPLTDLLHECQQKQHEVANAKDVAIGLGWALSDNMIWHNGGTGGFRSFLGFNPTTQRGVVILSNTIGNLPDELARELLDPTHEWK